MKTGIRIHGRDLFDKVDNIWLTCCALHNWLLQADGLDVRWEQGTQGDWEGSWGLHDEADAVRFCVPRDFDLSNMDDIDESGEVHDRNEEEQGEARLVRRMDLSDFRGKLIDHFMYKWRRRQVQWPSRNGQTTWEPPASLIAHAAAFAETEL